MTSLNPSLRLALISKAKGKKNLIQKGFTLVELVVVVAIVGVLAGVGLPSLLASRDRAAAQSTIGMMQGFASQCNSNIQNSSPTELEGIPALIDTTGLVGTNQCGITDLATGIYDAADTVTFANDPDDDGFQNPERLEGMRCGLDDQGNRVVHTGAETICTFTVANGRVTGDWS